MVDAGAQREASAYVWNVWAVIAAHRGQWARAEAANTTALERLGEVGDFNLEAEVWQTRSAIYICSGAFGAAETAWRRHRELAERKGNAQNLCWSRLDEAETRVGRDEIAGAARGARRRAGHPDRGERRQQHDREALRDGARPRRAGALRRGDRGRRRDHRDHRAPAAGGLSLRRLLRGRGARLLRRPRGRPLQPGGRAAQGQARLQARAPQLAPVRQRALAPLAVAGPARLGAGTTRAAHASAWRRAEATAVSMDMPLRARAGAVRDRAPRRRGRQRARPSWPMPRRRFERLGALQMLRRVREAQAPGQAEEGT